MITEREIQVARAKQWLLAFPRLALESTLDGLTEPFAKFMALQWRDYLTQSQARAVIGRADQELRGEASAAEFYDVLR